MSGGAAYIRLREPDNAISQGLQYWGGIAAQRGREKRSREDRERAKRDQENKEWSKEYKLDVASFQGKHTGFSKYDDIISDSARYMRDEFNTLKRKEADARQSGDLRKAENFSVEANSILQDFKIISQGDKALGEKYKSYQEAAQKGEISPASKGFENILDAVYNHKNAAIRYKTTPDGKKELVITGLTVNQADDLGLEGYEAGEPFTVPFRSIFDGEFNWINKADYDGKNGIINRISSNIGLMEKSGIDGDLVYNNKLWDQTFKTSDDINRVKQTISTSLSGDEIKDLSTRPRFGITEDMSNEEKRRRVIDGVYDDIKTSKDQFDKSTQRKISVSEQLDEKQKDRELRATEGAKNRANRIALNDADNQAALLRAEAKAKGKKPTQKEVDTELNKEASKKYYEWALKLKSAKTDEEAQQIIDNNDMGIALGNFLGVFGEWDSKKGNAIQIGKKVVNVRDSHDLAKAISAKVEGDDFKYDGTFAYNKITADMTPQELLEYYKNLK